MLTSYQRFDDRKDTVQQMIQIAKTDSRFNEEVYRYLLDVVETLGFDGQSSDEEDQKLIDGGFHTVFVAKDYVWRSKDVTSYLKMIDKLRIDFIKPPGGPPRTPRIRNYRTKSDIPVVGLPRAMYNEEWLKKQEEERPAWVATYLKVSDRRFELMSVDTSVLG